MKRTILFFVLIIMQFNCFCQTLSSSAFIDSLQLIIIKDLQDYASVNKFLRRVNDRECTELRAEKNRDLTTLEGISDCNAAYEKLDKEGKRAFEYEVEDIKDREFRRFQKAILLQIFAVADDTLIYGRDSSHIYISKDMKEDGFEDSKLYRLKTSKDDLFFTLVYRDFMGGYYLLTISKKCRLIDFINLLKCGPPFYMETVDKNKKQSYSVETYQETKITSDFKFFQQQETKTTNYKTQKAVETLAHSKVFGLNDDGRFREIH